MVSKERQDEQTAGAGDPAAAAQLFYDLDRHELQWDYANPGDYDRAHPVASYAIQGHPAVRFAVANGAFRFAIGY